VEKTTHFGFIKTVWSLRDKDALVTGVIEVREIPQEKLEKRGVIPS